MITTVEKRKIIYRILSTFVLSLRSSLTSPLAGASYCGAEQCPAGSASVCNRILVVDGGDDGGRCADATSWCADVQSKLLGTGAFTAVDTFDAYYGTPTAAQLGDYDAVLVFGHSGGFADAALLGDRLAAYHDWGGGVVVTVGANHPDWGSILRGAYGTPANGYALLTYAQGSAVNPSDTLGQVLEPQSPLMYGVTSLAATQAWRSTAPIVVGRGVVVARWGGGGQEPLVMRGTRGDRTLVELNFWPVSRWWTGDGAALMRNALKWSRCMQCGPGTFANIGPAGKEGGGGTVALARAGERAGGRDGCGHAAAPRVYGHARFFLVRIHTCSKKSLNSRYMRPSNEVWCGHHTAPHRLKAVGM